MVEQSPSTEITCAGCSHVLRIPGHYCPKCGRALQSPGQAEPEDPMIGEVIAHRYRLLKSIGRGGMGVVYQVEHLMMGKIMAMKLLHAQFNTRAHAAKRFQQEIKAVSRLSHVNTITVFDCGIAQENTLFIVMEYLRGMDLERLLRRDVFLPPYRAVHIARQVCASLAEAHEQGVIHRDIKPANIMLLHDRGTDDFVKVLDFGIAKLMEPGQNLVTEVGLIVGTPFYMAPEQAMGRSDLGPSIDMYALGVVLYEMVTGRLPFLGETTAEFLDAHLRRSPPRPSEVAIGPPIDPNLEAVILRALQKDPRDRYPSIEAMKIALDEYLDTQGTLRPSGVWIPSLPPPPASSLAPASPVSSPLLSDTPRASKKNGRHRTEASSSGTQIHAFEPPLLPQPDLAVTPPDLAYPQRITPRPASSSGVSSTKKFQREETPLLPPSAPLSLPSNPPLEIATRADWDRIERRWARSRTTRWLFPLLFFLALASWLGWTFWNQPRTLPPAASPVTAEIEPNHSILEATWIPLHAWVTGEMGQRQSQTSSDYDWFRFELPPGQEHQIAIQLLPPETLDLELGLYRRRSEGTSKQAVYRAEEIVSSNNLARGGEETIPSYLLPGGTYYLLVRELVVPGESPQENKGRYKLRVSLKEAQTNHEIEPNDQLSLALPIQPEILYSGLHDRKNDIDFYRLDLPEEASRTVRLRFAPSGSIKPSFLVLDKKGSPVLLRRRTLARNPSTGSQPLELRFTGQGRHFLRIRSKHDFDYKQPYTLQLLR